MAAASSEIEMIKTAEATKTFVAPAEDTASPKSKFLSHSPLSNRIASTRAFSAPASAAGLASLRYLIT